MPDRIGVAVVGCGFFAQNHLNAWRDLASDGVALIAVCDIDAEKAKAAAKTFNVPRWYTDLDALLAKATAALPTASMKKSGTTLRLKEPDAFLLYAGDAPGGTAYGIHRVTIPAGNYDVLSGTYSAGGESVEIYRLKPAGP